MAAKIDKEVAKFIEDAEQTAKQILQKEKGTLDKIAKTLIEKETIEREEFEKIVKPRKRNQARVAQWLEHVSYKDGVGGSSPPTRTRSFGHEL